MLLFIKLRSERLFKRAQAGMMPAQAYTSHHIREMRNCLFVTAHAMPPTDIVCETQTDQVPPMQVVPEVQGCVHVQTRGSDSAQ